MKDLFSVSIDNEVYEFDALKQLVECLTNQGYDVKKYEVKKNDEIVPQTIVNQYLKFCKPKPIVKVHHKDKKDQSVKIQLADTDFLVVLNKKHSNRDLINLK